MIKVRASPIHDRGVFAQVGIPAGTAFHVGQLLVFSCAESRALSATTVGSYVFHVEDCAAAPNAAEHEVTGLCMSDMSFANHSPAANTHFTVDGRARTVTFAANRDIAAGEEITIDYGDYAQKLGIA